MISAVNPGAFFREAPHLELLAASVLPALVRGRGGCLQLWSAGCSSGEAAWSLAMTVEEARLPAHLAVTILATDRDPAALARARDAVYRDDEMRGVSAERRRRHFVRGAGPRKGLWRVVAALRDRVEFVELDLMERWPERGAFDVVVCHDELAGVDPGTVARLVRRFGEVLGPGGVVLLGLVHALTGDLPCLEPCGPAAYRKIAS